MITISDAAKAMAENLARGFEGLVLTAYQNAHDVPTIGYGHTVGVQQGDTCSWEEAEEWLLDDMGAAAADVAINVTNPLTDHQAAALIDFAFNCGAMALNSSTLLREIDDGDMADAPAQLDRWVHDSSGAVLPGLVRRRRIEGAAWVTQDAATADAIPGDAA